ncbi:hypothetical protein I6A84_11465, partial [Frankia sp. CNm7]|uniref:hypothetical protein n=1 Tax=Frankia nepalensis TaxID=1836974 RepID=UPI001931A101
GRGAAATLRGAAARFRGGGGGGAEATGRAAAPAAEIGGRTLDSFRAVDNVRVTARLSSGSVENADTSWDLRIAGQTTSGTFTISGHKIEVIKIEADTYIRAGVGYYAEIGESDAADLLADRWVRLTERQADQYRFLTVDGIALSIEGYLTNLDGAVSKTTLDGRDAVRVEDRDGVTLYAATTGDPVPLRIDLVGQENGRLEFLEYGAAAVATAPADPVDLAGIG